MTCSPARRLSDALLLTMMLSLWCFGSGCTVGDVQSHYRRHITRVVGKPVLYVPGGDADLHMPVETTDAHLWRLRQTLKESGVEHLNLSATRITSASVDVISSIDSLRQLNVAFTELTTADVVSLARRLQLYSITIGHNELSQSEFKNLQQQIGKTYLFQTFDRRNP